jgi:hypothetical protein
VTSVSSTRSAVTTESVSALIVSAPVSADTLGAADSALMAELFVILENCANDSFYK